MDSGHLASGLCQICAELAPEERPCSTCRVALDGEEGAMQLAHSDSSRASESQASSSLEPSESNSPPSAKRQRAETSGGAQGEQEGVDLCPSLLGFPPAFVQQMFEMYTGYKGTSGPTSVSQNVQPPTAAQSLDPEVQLEGDQDDGGSDSMPCKDSSLLEDAASQQGSTDQGEDAMVRLFKQEDLLEVISESLRILHLDSPQTPAVQRSVMSSAKPQSICFPSHPDITVMLTEQWDAPEGKLQVSQTMNKLYPLAEEFEAFIMLPKVDSYVAKITDCKSVPSEGGMVLKDLQDRRLEWVLQRQFRAVALGLKAAAAASLVARACHTLLHQGPAEEKDVYPHFLLLGMDYIVDALYDMFRVMSKVLAFSICARRMLWIRQWAGDYASKATLSRLPFKGQMLFGEGLEDLVASVAKRKPKPKSPPKNRPQSPGGAGRSSFRGSQRFHQRARSSWGNKESKRRHEGGRSTPDRGAAVDPLGDMSYDLLRPMGVEHYSRRLQAEYLIPSTRSLHELSQQMPREISRDINAEHYLTSLQTGYFIPSTRSFHGISQQMPRESRGSSGDGNAEHYSRRPEAGILVPSTRSFHELSQQTSRESRGSSGDGNAEHYSRRPEAGILVPSTRSLREFSQQTPRESRGSSFDGNAEYYSRRLQAGILVPSTRSLHELSQQTPRESSSDGKAEHYSRRLQAEMLVPSSRSHHGFSQQTPRKSRESRKILDDGNEAVNSGGRSKSSIHGVGLGQTLHMLQHVQESPRGVEAHPGSQSGQCSFQGASLSHGNGALGHSFDSTGGGFGFSGSHRDLSANPHLSRTQKVSAASRGGGALPVDGTSLWTGPCSTYLQQGGGRGSNASLQGGDTGASIPRRLVNQGAVQGRLQVSSSASYPALARSGLGDQLPKESSSTDTVSRGSGSQFQHGGRPYFSSRSLQTEIALADSGYTSSWGSDSLTVESTKVKPVWSRSRWN
uniref:Uncharacterized protein LOC117354525 n=1 Tax=Geotrypetes seraphini TaxID=260995 RepID=A0A6P8QKU1_GEOSA|nr:uncharacterized protein LOC117354525 [Geotrypetes seraphini]XP_033788092.1 uncharacterized protein LOC117354525 [Geotrypetes seraphini]XP_033788093.1 uncharacterized protein LOC117354525 [Geotrypetes seraphini]XP_033788094.1 uncharacterized protein LOC117354525 [Geotrypetes seraphini]XP_033788096.1 uncharacterized protein LOC117354525 [Geotrypetes seraphini]XP_033788097.1 uncharacterized protein LOC117354525 [Geotrypetes seraphini]XP_033788098.1 uncharacterized protein LOC117354525 [Geotry